MAQRFAIDGNFTQSFVGTVSLNTQACPSNNSEDFASLFYDLDTGTVCYITSSTDFCYEFIFDNENTITLSKNSEGVQSQPPAQSFQFVGDPNTPPIGATNLSAPKNSLTNTKFLMFDSSSANAGSILNYLIQNTSSGSIKLSSTTQAVEINYTTQAQTGSLGNNKIIIGNSNNLPAFASSSFSVLTTTSDTPFTHGERVCVEVNSAGSGGSSTTYQTGSDATQVNLTNLKVIDYDNNVYLTSNPITGELTLQFGTPQEPLSLSGGLNGFNTNRFNKNQDTYNGTFTYNLNGTTFVSASLIDVTGGGQIVKTSTDGDGNISFTNFSGGNPQATGSRTFKTSLRVILEDATQQNFESSNFSGTLNKTDPGRPTITSVVSTNIQGGTDQTNYSSTTAFSIHIGATGSIVRDSGSGTLNDWEFDGGGGTVANGNLTLTYNTAINEPSATVENFFKSPSGENDPDIFYTSSRGVSSNRKFVWKYGAAATASLLEGNTTDLKYLQDLGFLSSSNNSGFDEDPIGESFTIQGNSFDYHYLIVKDNVGDATPTITVEGSTVTFPEVAQYTNIEGSVGYRVFRTGQQGASPVTYTYSSD